MNTCVGGTGLCLKELKLSVKHKATSASHKGVVMYHPQTTTDLRGFRVAYLRISLHHVLPPSVAVSLAARTATADTQPSNDCGQSLHR